MPDLQTVLILIAVVLAVAGAIRYDLLGLVMRSFARDAALPQGPQTPDRVERVKPPHDSEPTHPAPPYKPPFHRSGRRH